MESLEKRGLVKKYPWMSAPVQLLLCGFFLTFATPMCCALFPQIYPISVSKLESEIQVTFFLIFMKCHLFTRLHIHVSDN